MSIGYTMNPTTRFSSRVENYVKYRPGYPVAIVALLEGECGLTAQSVVADIGSGTGLLTKLFLDHGNDVYGVEPNADMRAAGEALLASYPNFISVNGAAEATTLSDESVDFVTAGQAFHWFDASRAKVEFQRILRRGGWVVLVWNNRQSATSPFLRDYEQLLKQYSNEYEASNHRTADPSSLGVAFRYAEFEYVQVFDFDGMKGRMLSSSYAPLDGPNYEALLRELRRIFDQYNVDGKVEIRYTTQVHYGQFSY